MLARRAAAAFVVILAVTLALDQGSKAWAHGLPTQPAGCAQPAALLAGRCAGVAQPVIDGFWDWELAYNPGVAFSTFASLTGRAGVQIVLALLAALALAGITVLALRTPPAERTRRVGYALIGGGALGNLIDRVRDGAVTDFVRWRIHDHRWPIFNVADAALLLGVALIVLGGTRRRRPLAAA
jgi:signal peptidase II